MRYSFDLTVPAATPTAEPVSLDVKLDTGTLTQVIIRFRAGCHNRVHVAVHDAILQIVPANGTTPLYGDNQMIFIPMAYLVTSSPHTLTIKGWSPYTRYDHVISFWFDLLETEVEKRSGVASSILHLLKG